VWAWRIFCVVAEQRRAIGAKKKWGKVIVDKELMFKFVDWKKELPSSSY